MELINGHGSITLLNCFFRILLSFCSAFLPPAFIAIRSAIVRAEKPNPEKDDRASYTEIAPIDRGEAAAAAAMKATGGEDFPLDVELIRTRGSSQFALFLFWALHGILSLCKDNENKSSAIE